MRAHLCAVSQKHDQKHDQDSALLRVESSLRNNQNTNFVVLLTDMDVLSVLHGASTSMPQKLNKYQMQELHSFSFVSLSRAEAYVENTSDKIPFKQMLCLPLLLQLAF